MKGNEKVKFAKKMTSLDNKNPQKNKEDINRQKIKETFIKQFNLSDEEAEEKLRELERKNWSKLQTNTSKKEKHSSNKSKKATLKHPENYKNIETIGPQHVLDREKNE
ncbi:MAG: hypothetical protein IKF11_03495, partial [Methanobrevibacter sp.]|nr:hypothetical protein [Methanobrevibacter sp.]